MANERVNNLTGHSVLLVETEYVLGEMHAEGYVLHGMKQIETRQSVPNDLLAFMNNYGLESAIIHTAILEDEAPLLEAHKAGKKIVVIVRDPPTTYEEADMYKRLEKAGIVTTPKRLFYESKAFRLLSELFVNASQENST